MNKQQPSGKFSFPQLVEYQPGSIVSRPVMQKESGNITIFAFDKGQYLSEHSAPFDALVQVVDGTAEIKIGGEPHHLSSGESIIMPANVPHAVHALTQFQMILTMIKSK